MKKIRSSKLQLARETVRALTPPELSAAGGLIIRSFVCTIAYTWQPTCHCTTYGGPTCAGRCDSNPCWSDPTEC